MSLYMDGAYLLSDVRERLAGAENAQRNFGMVIGGEQPSLAATISVLKAIEYLLMAELDRQCNT